MIKLRCRILAKLGRPQTSVSLFIVNTHTDSQTTPSSEWKNQGQETFFRTFCWQGNPQLLGTERSNLYLYIVYHIHYIFIHYILIYILLHVYIYIIYYIYILFIIYILYNIYILYYILYLYILYLCLYNNLTSTLKYVIPYFHFISYFNLIFISVHIPSWQFFLGYFRLTGRRVNKS